MSISEVKKHIDNARQILVGVVPNPTSQIDQITNALIYKFMDDMDQKAIKIGGKAAFFIGDLAKYSWTKIFESKGNQERMNLYVEGFIKIAEAKNIPPLFRNILKSAYLPYRQPETLGLFLKEINHFDYSHPEELGDAYEYLLSIMSSQGDAGQFRTPRHIIDFMVDVIDPKKDETILDPACGTAGFLISSYKHILKFHQDKKNKELTPQDKKTLIENFEGYDIDPAMTRIAQVNMFLHEFRTPKIFQYDALSSEEKWSDKFDIILANPPFMSPKGGIKPHSKFSVESSRSEVLFVDYIINHLTPKGRAAIIVPEGIIFQSGTSYKDLRKNLVEDGLYAVASLPSGVFNPYSGVKTSILFFDKEFAKNKGEILFVKIENDGFHLGAQRKQIDKNDLPKAAEILKQYKKGKKIEDKIAAYVARSEIAKSGDYNLSASRYIEAVDYSNAKWEMVDLEGVFLEIKNGKNVNQFDEIGKYKVSRIQTIADGTFNLEKTKFTNDPVNENDILQEGDILFSHINSFEHLAKTAIFENINERVVHGANLIRLRANKNKIIPKYALFILKSDIFVDTARSFAQKAVNQASINSTVIKRFKIPLPPLEIQEQIVRELNSYQNIITGARQIITNWKPKIDIDPNWENVKLGHLCKKITKGSSPNWQGIEYVDQNGILFVTSENVGNGELLLSNRKYVEKRFNEIEKKSILHEGDVLTNIVGASIGRTAIFNLKEITNINQAVCILRCKENLINNLYLMRLLNSDFFLKILHENKVDNARANLSLGFFENLTIPLPPLETQQKIVAQIEAERQSVESAKKLIEIYEQKTKATIAKLWN